MQIVQDYYESLGIAPNANLKEIKEAYRKLAFQYHPDRNQMNPSANEKMLEINEAYNTLSDPTKRKDYDIPRGYYTIVPKFKKGGKVKVNYHSHTQYRDHTGVVDKEPIKDTFRFWYMVRFELKGFSTVSRFAEEELSENSDW
jgi:curved DNA-binding protein CbpA